MRGIPGEWILESPGEEDTLDLDTRDEDARRKPNLSRGILQIIIARCGHQFEGVGCDPFEILNGMLQSLCDKRFSPVGLVVTLQCVHISPTYKSPEYLSARFGLLTSNTERNTMKLQRTER